MLFYALEKMGRKYFSPYKDGENWLIIKEKNILIFKKNHFFKIT
jgi:hypothetical protein